jgi:deoxyribose-phosphate aldolase
MTPCNTTDLSRCIEDPILKPETSQLEIRKRCLEAREHSFYGVVLNGSRIAQACALLEESPVKVIGTVGFPLGAMEADVKRFEAETAIDHGAQEIEMVLNIGRLKDREESAVLRELRDVVEAAEERPVSVIIETGLLTREEKILACQLVVESGAHCVSMSTGFLPGNASAEDVKLIRRTVGEKFCVKASGEIRDTRTTLAMIEAGANRISTICGIAIVRGLSAATSPARG